MDNDFIENCLPFWNMLHFYIFEHCRISCFCPGLRKLTVFGTNLILNQIPLSEQNIFYFSNYVCKLLNYHLKSIDRIKPFQIKYMCSLE